jgi:hypothetical protein
MQRSAATAAPTARSTSTAAVIGIRPQNGIASAPATTSSLVDIKKRVSTAKSSSFSGVNLLVACKTFSKPNDYSHLAGELVTKQAKDALLQMHSIQCPEVCFPFVSFC